jgi:hypothetical protein
MALNTGEAPQRFSLGGKGLAWTMTGQSLDTRAVLINGKAPSLAPDGTLTGLGGTPVAGKVSIPGHGIAFYAVPGARNPACR